MATKVLIVDDDPVVRIIASEYLAVLGAEVQTASNGVEATRQIASGQPDLVMLDLNMPGISGVELLREIKSTPEAATLPIVILSANFASESRDIVEKGNLKADYYLEKPFNLKSLREALSLVARH